MHNITIFTSINFSNKNMFNITFLLLIINKNKHNITIFTSINFINKNMLNITIFTTNY